MKQTFFLLFLVCLYLSAPAEDNRPSLEDSAYQNRKKFDYFFLEAIRLKENGRHGEAYAALQYALKIDSTSSAALSLLADYYLSFYQDSLAVDALQKAVKYSPDNFQYKVSLADIYREMGNFAEAIQLYESLVAEQPAKPELNFYLSDLYLKQNQIDKAIYWLDALENSIGMNEALSMQKFKLYLAVGQTENAVNELEKLAAKFPLEAKYQILIGDYYLENEDPDKALTYYEKAHKMDPQSPYYVVSMANYYEKKGDTEAVHSLFKTLMEQRSQEKDLNLMYGRYLISQGKLEEARFQFQVVTEADPENLLAWNMLMNIAIKENNPDEVIHICNTALAIFPNNFEFYFNKGLACYQMKNYPEALAVFQNGSKFIPEEEVNSLSILYGQIGDLYHQMNKKEEAYRSYEKSLEYNENNIAVLNNYAYFLSLDKTDLDKAERMVGKCIKMQPGNPTYIDTYAWVFFQKGNYSLAKFYIESAISNGGEQSPDILEHYGDILYKTGNPDRAVEQWEKALKAKEEGEDTTLLKKKIENRTYYDAN